MGILRFKWWQAEMLKDQIETGLTVAKLSCEGHLTLDNGCTVEWDQSFITVEVPPDEPDTKEALHDHARP